jgi:geranylgeranyl diphosphate synthase type I
MATHIQAEMLTAIEQELKRQVKRLDLPPTQGFHDMLAYHMGWTGEGAGPQAAGKRIRPLLALLSCASAGGKRSDIIWLHAVSVAASIELVHNFSLVHDDIQDNSKRRRGRITAWVRWGAPMAINVGDALFVLANQSALDLREHYLAETVVRTAKIINDACLELTKGQYLDMSYEDRSDLKIEHYWPMVAGKTSALLSTCTQVGAILGYAQDEQIESYRLFGHFLGLAFQVQDDILGIWGDESVTGKSAAGDLVEGKNSLPILFGLERNGEFAKRWAAGPIKPDEVGAVAALLESEGGKSFAEETADGLTQKALSYLEKANPQGEAGDAMRGLADMLLKRSQ